MHKILVIQRGLGIERALVDFVICAADELALSRVHISDVGLVEDQEQFSKAGFQKVSN